jgi:hypothetical protein
MAKYIVRITRTLIVEADSVGEATTMSLYATAYPDHITGIEYINHDAKVIPKENEAFKELQDWPENSGN